MTRGTHLKRGRIDLGEMALTPVVTSRFRLDGGSMFGVIPKVLWSAKAPADSENRIELNTNALAVQDGGRLIVIEPGMGSKYDERRRDIYALEELDAVDALRSAGIEAGDVDMVIPTHLHLDHAGGSTAFDESGSVACVFPAATFVVQQREWEAAMNPGPLEKGSYNPQDYAFLLKSERLRMVSGTEEVAPGVSVELTGGHTRGHQVVRMRSGAEEALYLGDIVPTTAHLRLNWLMAWDLEPAVVYEAKARLLADAAARGSTCFFAHDPRVAAAKLQDRGRGSFDVIENTVIEAV
jgi:glyoxylase-like metal-dependent hydrolase (beta-lactamase superfamily II)